MRLPFNFTRTFLGLCLGISLFAQTAPQRPAPPPEYTELTTALQIEDVAARIKELQRIKTAYPNSQLMEPIELNLLAAITQNADTFDKLLAAQKEFMGSSKVERYVLLINAAHMLSRHEKIAEFPKQAVLKALQDYKAEAMPLFDAPDFGAKYPEERRKEIHDMFSTAFELPLAKAFLANGDGKTALNTLEEYAKVDDSPDPDYYVILGEVYVDQKRDNEALEAFFKATVDGYKPATEHAKKLFEKINGADAKFEAELERRQTQLPFQPPPFKAPENWKGKTVLAEVFTGSECPPCVAAGFAFDGLKQTYPAQYLAILKYHTPIPRYDPMMNPATNQRQDFYQPRGNPTVIIDGVKEVSVGGSRAMAFGSFNRVKAEIDPILGADTDITIKATATIKGDNVQVDCNFSKVIDGADYNVVLVQSEENFQGGNGYSHHMMVVRDFKTVKPADKATVTFNIPASEKATGEYITEWGKTAPQGRMQGSKWPEQRNTIDRNKLKAVVFVQDKETKHVHNAFVVDAKK